MATPEQVDTSLASRAKEALVDKEALETLLKSHGWHILMKVLGDQMKMLENQILLTPLSSNEGVYMQEFNKGHRMGLTVFAQLPQQLVSQLEAVVEAISPNEDDDNE